MPLIVRELIIRASLNGDGQAAGTGQDEPANQAEDAAQAGGKENIVTECVEQILEILAKKEDR